MRLLTTTTTATAAFAAAAPPASAASSASSARRHLIASTSRTRHSSSSSFFSTTAHPMFALSKPRRAAAGGNPADAQPRTLSNQRALPRLPVPTLEQTAAKYLRSLEPILHQAEERAVAGAAPTNNASAKPVGPALAIEQGSSAEKELQRRREWVEELLKEGGLGRRLQQRLLDVDATTPHNWLDDRYWLQKAYHEWRAPLLINSNWWLLFTTDAALGNVEAQTAQAKPTGTAALPFEQVRERSAKALQQQHGTASADAQWPPSATDLLGYDESLGSKGWHPDQMQLGIRRAAWLAWRLAEFKLRLDREDILPDASRAGPFCMHQYTNVFGVTRIPALPHDWNTRPAAPAHLPDKAVGKAGQPARHVTVIVRNRYYALTIIEPTEGKIVRPEALEEALAAIVQDAYTRTDGDGEGVGVLSSDERDTWARTREHLLSLSETNAATLRSIETSLFAIALDTTVLGLPDGYAAPPSEASRLWVDALARNCSGAGRGGHNRWFDKSMTLTVEPNGRAGINGEHSPVDALIPSILADYTTGVPCPAPGTPFPALETTAGNEVSEAPATFVRTDFVLDDVARADIADSTSRALALAADSDIRVLYFDEYGADWIKKVGKHSPDAYLQMALQVAMALTHGWQTPTYETASTRIFRNGRTDVIRSFSAESYAFVKALLRGQKGGDRSSDDEAHNAELYKLLSAATAAHNAQTRESSLGRGIDRHLTGLRLVYNAETDEELGGMPKLLADDVFATSQNWTLSTSGLSAGDRLAGTGFGAGYHDGYGCNYLAGAKLLKFGLESKYSHPETSTTVFAQNLAKALRIMKHICEHSAPAPADSKVELPPQQARL